MREVLIKSRTEMKMENEEDVKRYHPKIRF